MSETNKKVMCLSCGCFGTMRDIKQRNPKAVSCCPERNEVDVIKHLIGHHALQAENERLKGERDAALKMLSDAVLHKKLTTLQAAADGLRDDVERILNHEGEVLFRAMEMRAIAREALSRYNKARGCE